MLKVDACADPLCFPGGNAISLSLYCLSSGEISVRPVSCGKPMMCDTPAMWQNLSNVDVVFIIAGKSPVFGWPRSPGQAWPSGIGRGGRRALTSPKIRKVSSDGAFFCGFAPRNGFARSTPSAARSPNAIVAKKSGSISNILRSCTVSRK